MSDVTESNVPVPSAIKPRPLKRETVSAAPIRVQMVVACITLLIAAVFLFFRLGHYALWDDEANTALIGEGVWQTGDTSAVLGHNVVGYRNGAVLSNLKERYDPPLQYFIAAPMVGLFPRSALAARIPFAIAGFLAICLILWWLHKTQASTLTFILMAMGLVGNVSLWLYCRQCRYYSFSILFSIVVSYLYLCAAPTRKTVLLIAAASCALLASNYLSYASLYAIIGLDFLLWGRNRFKISWQNWLLLWMPQIVFGAIVCSIWNPLGKVVQNTASGGLIGKVILFWWAWRDTNWCEFGVLPLVAIAPILWYFRRDSWLLRAPLAVLCYVVSVAVLSPQKGWIWLDGKWVYNTSIYDIRYLATVIPLLIVISVMVIRHLFPSRLWWLTLVLAGIAFGTNLLNGAWLAENPAEQVPKLRSTLYLYVGELLNPPSDPYTPAIAWINGHIKNGESVWVLPDYMAYPLMFHAPQAIYAWQFSFPPAPQFKDLPAIQFQRQALPDYVICFGPVVQEFARSRIFPPGTRGELVATLDQFWHDLYRPEFLLRSFKTVSDFGKQDGAIYIFHLKPPPANQNFHL